MGVRIDGRVYESLVSVARFARVLHVFANRLRTVRFPASMFMPRLGRELSRRPIFARRRELEPGSAPT